MSVGQQRSARHKMIMRYKRPGYRSSVSEAIAAERQRAAREVSRKKKK